MNAESLEARNAEFWNELCGSSLARHIGITDHSPASLRRFDEAYMGLYPYLLRRVPMHTMAGREVLEVGLGFGTLGQKIAEAGARYIGLDIAEGPVRMMNYRLHMLGRPPTATTGSMLSCPLADESVDCVVSIGCFHHTGDAQRCFDETWRVLRPRGRAYLMVYNRFSWRQWRSWPGATFSAWLAERRGEKGAAASWSQRIAYDSDATGAAAPETAFFSTSELRRMLSRFSAVRMSKENCDHLLLGGPVIVPRALLLPVLGRVLGLDIYMALEK